MQNILCRHCFRLFRYDEIGVLCRSSRCHNVLDIHGVENPRYMRARESGFWRRWGRRLDLGRACPHCEQIGTVAPACPLCRGQLEVGIGEVDDKVIAVIGASASGKSHFLATVLHQLLDERVGGGVWQVEMKKEDLALYRREFLRPLFENQEELPSTPRELRPELRILLESRHSDQKTLLVFRDLGGEIFKNYELLRELTFLRYAQGVVLMADPLAFEPPPASNGQVVSWTRDHRRSNATQVLDLYRRVLETQERYEEHRALPLLPEQKYLAVAVTKADLVLPPDHAFWDNDPTPLGTDFWRRREAENATTRHWVRHYLDRGLAEIADSFADVGYFFVSSYGYNHTPGTRHLEHPLSPRKVHEPIFGLLDRFANSASGKGGDLDPGL